MFGIIFSINQPIFEEYRMNIWNQYNCSVKTERSNESKSRIENTQNQIISISLV